MSIQDLGSIGELVAAFATIATLAYLAIQIRTNSSIAKAESIRENINSWDQAIHQLWEDHETTGIVRALLNGDSDQVDAEGIMMFGARMGHLINQHFAILKMYEAGLADEDLKERIDNAVVFFLNSPGGNAWWKTTGHLFPNHKYISALLTNARPNTGFSDWETTLQTGLANIGENR